MRGPGGPSRASSGVPIRTPGAVTAGRRTVLPSQECRRVPGSKDGGVSRSRFRPHVAGPTTGEGAEQAYKHRARDALGLADLRHALPIARTRAEGEHTGLRQASMSRGVEARGSNWTPGVPRALGSSSGRCGSSRTQRRTRRRKETGRWRLSGANRASHSASKTRVDALMRALLWLARRSLRRRRAV